MRLCSGCGRQMFSVTYHSSEGDGFVVTRRISRVCATCDWITLWPNISGRPEVLELIRREADPKLFPRP